MSVISNSTLAGSSGQGGGGGYAIERSLRLNSGDSSYLNRTPSSAGNQKTWTYSFWIKYCGGSGINGATSTWILWGGANTTNFAGAYFSANSLRVFQYNGSGYDYQLDTTQVFRDQSAWYHFVIACDTTQATASNRVKVYVNGQEITTFSTSTYPTQNLDTHINSATQQNLGGGPSLASYLSAYLADVHFIDGQALAPTDFGEYDDSNVWQPKKFAGTYGTNGFHLPFSDNSTAAALGTDTSGNGNTWTVNNLSVAAGAGNDSLRDSPVNGNSANDTGAGGEITGNYATLNPLGGTHTSLLTFSNGNLECNATASSGNSDKMAAQATIGVISGKFYWEASGMVNSLPGLAIDFSTNNSYVPAETIILNQNGTYYNNGSATAPSNAASWTSSDVIGVALNMDDKELTFYKNGVAQGTFTGLVNQEYFPSRYQDSSGSNSSSIFNFGQRAFAYTAPSGYKCLNTAALSDPTIADGSTAFDTKLWTGNGSTQTITGLNFSPDLLWYKSRSVAHHHGLQNTVSGVGKSLSSSTTAAEYTETTGLDSFTSDGFNLDGDGYYSINRSGHSMVAWAWDAGSSNTTIAAGSLNSSLYDQSQTWSNYVTGTAYGGYPITNAFDGDTSTRSLESGSTGHTFTPPSAITVNSSLRIYLQYANSSATNALKVNGTDKSNLITTTGSNLGWLTIPGITSITSLFWGVSPAGAETCSISAIEVDGKILVDSGVSVTNVPSIASTVRANPSAGFSIVTHSQGASNSTVGHGLGATPKMIISRPRNQTSSWLVYHYDLGKDKILRLNTADASSTVSNLWGTAEPTSSVFGVGAAGSNSNNWGDVISYCFAPVEGYSAMGSYVGNGSNDGSFVFTGFAVKWLLTKASSAGSDWQIWDVSRQPYNVNANTLTPNSSAAESGTAGYAVDLLSNGFKFRLYGSSANASGVTYAWAAFAEHPFKTSRAR